MKKKKKKDERISTLDIMKGIRKPMPKPTRIIPPKKQYDRKNKDWEEGDE